MIRRDAEIRTRRAALRRREPFRRSAFGRKWRTARDTVGLPADFRFYDLRHTGNTLAADTGAKLKDLMVRAGQSTPRAQLIYQHSNKKHQRKIAKNIDANVRRQLSEEHAQPQRRPAGEARVHRLFAPSDEASCNEGRREA